MLSDALPIIKPFRLKSAESVTLQIPLKNNSHKETENTVSNPIAVIDDDNRSLSKTSNLKDALEILTKDKSAFLTFSNEIIDAEGFIEDAMAVAPDIYWMFNFPAIYYLKTDFLLKAMDCDNFNLKVFRELPEKITHRSNVMYKFFALDFLEAYQFYFGGKACAYRDEHQCNIHTSCNSYLGGLNTLFSLQDRLTGLNFDRKKGENFSTYIYNYNENRFIEKLANNRQAWTKAYIVYGNHLCFDLFLEGLNLEALNAIKATLIGEDGLGLKTAKELIEHVNVKIQYQSRTVCRKVVDGFIDVAWGILEILRQSLRTR